MIPEGLKQIKGIKILESGDEIPQEGFICRFGKHTVVTSDEESFEIVRLYKRLTVYELLLSLVDSMCAHSKEEALRFSLKKAREFLDAEEVYLIEGDVSHSPKGEKLSIDEIKRNIQKRR